MRRSVVGRLVARSVPMSEAESAALAAARLAGTIGDVLGGLDEPSVAAGRLAGRVEVLLWAQTELQLQLERMVVDRFADTRGVSEFLLRVQDNLRAVQDGSGALGELVVSVVEGPSLVRGEAEGPPGAEMGD